MCGPVIVIILIIIIILIAIIITTITIHFLCLLHDFIVNLDAGLVTGSRLAPCVFFYFISGIQMLTYFHNNNNNNNNNNNDR